MKPQTMEFDAPEFSAFCLVGETVDDGARLLTEKREREAAAADLERRQVPMDFNSLPAADAPVMLDDLQEIETTHWLEVKAYRSKDCHRFFVELIDDRDDTWAKYCEILGKKGISIPERVVGKNR